MNATAISIVNMYTTAISIVYMSVLCKNEDRFTADLQGGKFLAAGYVYVITGFYETMQILILSDNLTSK